MNSKLKKAVTLLAALTVAVSAGTFTAMAAEEDATSYSYLTGQQQNSLRHSQFESASSLETDAEREAFFSSRGIGSGSAYSEAQHLDAQELVEAGMIDQETADAITAYASAQHSDLHTRYAGKSNLTPEGRHSFYAAFQSDGWDGDSVDGLLNAGIITQAQADAINEYLSR